MTWNYRIMKYGKSKAPEVGLHEVYYDANGKVESWTQDPIITGEDPEDLLAQLETMKQDILQSKGDILDYEQK